MCPQRELIHRLSLEVDGSGQVLGAVIVRHWSSDHEQIEPIGVGPFDTPEEVLQRLKERLDIQMTLW